MDPFEISKGRVQRGLAMAANPNKKWEALERRLVLDDLGAMKAKAVPQQAKPYGPRALKRLKRNP